jgi:hypothetical protein
LRSLPPARQFSSLHIRNLEEKFHPQSGFGRVSYVKIAAQSVQ